ncbi:hypothetical protein LJR225_001387 [Phenylobacterium sp. LjRoot225]|uniref:hypothetical protein n=1 Tax=Phenylobacterium sp. LjRoot225 TaxID=3342285 RepID=UPI003ECD8D37
MRQLIKFSVTVREEDFVFHLVDDAGQTTDFAASPEQFDAVIDALDELLSENEDDEFEIEDDEPVYQKPLS